ncbi:undecaprenyl-diphosphate phosphatase [Clostridium polynesiense]|uniref:undecaprenyl-diphosphate phosphatase n=1 Tax=Clostridium polynesiense TaxID=1325933 RepID=UPI00058ED67F|nr:undecaprenyl-diphosphate phosphatase [Clostridium polynesiense]
MDFVYIFKAVIIAIVEGITEFLPISSSGHMILVGDLINFNDGKFSTMFQIVIQLGAILAVVVLYFSKIKKTVISFFKLEPYGLRFWITILIGFLPAAVIGFLLDDYIDQYLFNSKTVAIGFIAGGILLIIIENNFRKKSRRKKVTTSIDKVKFSQAIKIGFFQCIAMWPGMSRSASTIMGGWIAGLNNVAAAEFSFFLAIPTMVGASALKLIKYKGFSTITSTEVTALILGFIVAFLVALIVVDSFMNFLKKRPMRVFAIYRIFIGIILAVLIFNGIIV